MEIQLSFICCKGTMHTIDLAKVAGIPVTIIHDSAVKAVKSIFRKETS